MCMAGPTRIRLRCSCCQVSSGRCTCCTACSILSNVRRSQVALALVASLVFALVLYFAVGLAVRIMGGSDLSMGGNGGATPRCSRRTAAMHDANASVQQSCRRSRG